MFITKFRKSVQYSLSRHLLGKKRLVAKSNSGAKFIFSTADGVGRCIYKKGYYEPSVSRFLFDRSPKSSDALFIDVGANLGYYSVHMAMKGFSVFSFEPDPLNYELLSTNLKHNGCTDVEPIQGALSDKKGAALLYRYPEKNLGRHSILPVNNSEPIEIKTFIFDDLLEERRIDPKKIELVKIDVEGFEPLVLRGMSKVLTSASPTIVAEFSPRLMEQGGVDVEEFLSFMESAGYSASLITDKAIVSLSAKQLRSSSLKEGSNLVWRKHTQADS